MRTCDICQNAPATITVTIEVTDFFPDREAKEKGVSHDVCETCRQRWKDRIYGADDDARRDAQRERRMAT